MRALLLAGGLGTRLRPLTNSIPKCLVPIYGKPLLSYWLDLLLPRGIEKVLINTHYLSESVEEFAAKSRWRNRMTLVHEDELLGTGGTIRANREFFNDQAFIVAHADNLTFFDVDAFINHHDNRPAGIDVTMMTFKTDTPSSCGVIKQDNMGRVTELHEKSATPPGDLANAAIYIFEPSVIELITTIGEGRETIDISTELLPKLIGRMWTFHNHHYLRDIGSIESLRMAEQEFRDYNISPL